MSYFDEVVQKLLRMCQMVLHNNGDIDLEVPFYELGIDSLQMMVLVKEIKDQFKVELPISFLFEYPTIKSIANFLTEKGECKHD